MSYRIEWRLTDGTPAPGPELGVIQPGDTKSITRMLVNTGEESFRGVQFTLMDDLDGNLTVTVNGDRLTKEQTYTTGSVGPGESVTVVYTRFMPTTSAGGSFRAYIDISALK